MTVFPNRQVLARPVPSAFGHTRTHGPGRQLTLAVGPFRDGAVLALSGELDVAVAAGFDADVNAAVAQGMVRLVLDLSDLDFCDCCGLSALVRARRLALERHGWVRLARVPPRLTRIIRIAGLGSAFPCYPSVDDAFDNTQRPIRTSTRARLAGERTPGPAPR
ncbi:STAS domain-containing protein [Catenulispora yoronensis]